VNSDSRGGGKVAPAGFLLFASGAIALVYETLWVRRFSDVFGATTPAVAATLAAYFLGLAAGSAAFGKWAVRLRRPLRAYAWIEMGVAAGAIFVGPLLSLFDQRLAPLAASPQALVAARLGWSVVVLFVPAFFMGGTLPVMVQAEAARGRAAGRGILPGTLYASNTLGAVLGALSVPFFWLPVCGGSRSLVLCAIANVTIGAVAWGMSPRDPDSAVETSDQIPKVLAGISPGNAADRLPGIAVSLLAAFSGLSLFILEIDWARLFAQVHESSIYSFSVVLATFLAGLAAGGWFAGKLLARGFSLRALLAFGWCAGGLAVLVSPRILWSLTKGFSYIGGSGGWLSYGAKLFGLAALTLLVPTMLAGLVLPLLLNLVAARPDERAPRVGFILSVNLAGSIAGLVAAAFFLPRLTGTVGGIGVVGIGMMICGALVFPGERAVGWRRLAVIAVIGTAAFALQPFGLPGTKIERGESLVSLAEGSHGIVAVVERSGRKRLKLDNVYVVGGTGSAGDERMQAHIPLLLHPAPRDVLFLGLGTGITASGALFHPVEKITIAELVPEIAAAARHQFGEENLGVLESQRSELVLDDARAFLSRAPGRFDVIVGDLVVPWRRGEAALFSGEHFQRVRSALRPGGIFCQWIPLFQLSEDELDIVAATFLDVFPAATLWRGDFAPDRPALALIGHLGGEAIDPAAVARRIASLSPDPENPQLADESGFWIFAIGPLDPSLPRFVRARRNRQDTPWLELLGPMAGPGDRGEKKGGRRVFTGPGLEAFLDEIRGGSIARTPFARFSPEILDGRDAGKELAAGTIAFSDGRFAEARSRFTAVGPRLSPAVRRAVVGDAGASTTSSN